MVRRVRVHRYFALGSLVLLAVLGIVVPSGVRSLMMQIMIFGIFAMGYDVCLGFTDQCSLGHSLYFGAGAYGCVLSMIHLKAGLITSLGISVASGFVLAFLLGLICVRLSEAYFVIVTAIIAAVFHLLAMDLIWLTGGDDGLSVSLPPLKLGFIELSLYQPLVNYYFVLFFMAVSYFVLARILDAPLGKIFVAIRENPKRAHFLGYNVTRYKHIAFVISCMFAALAGGLVRRDAPLLVGRLPELLLVRAAHCVVPRRGFRHAGRVVDRCGNHVAISILCQRLVHLLPSPFRCTGPHHPARITERHPGIYSRQGVNVGLWLRTGIYSN